MEKIDKYLVYENWQAEKKAVVHLATCGHAKEGLKRLKEYDAPNDRWFGFFNSLDDAETFASLLPDRNHKLCGVCLKKGKNLF